jgi:hypothetical protein
MGLQLWKIWMLRWKLLAWEVIRQNINFSAEECLGYYELKEHKPRFNKGCSKLLDQRNRLNCSGYRVQVK